MKRTCGAGNGWDMTGRIIVLAKRGWDMTGRITTETVGT